MGRAARGSGRATQRGPHLPRDAFLAELQAILAEPVSAGSWSFDEDYAPLDGDGG